MPAKPTGHDLVRDRENAIGVQGGGRHQGQWNSLGAIPNLPLPSGQRQDAYPWMTLGRRDRFASPHGVVKQPRRLERFGIEEISAVDDDRQ